MSGRDESEDFDYLLQRLAPMSEEEQFETLLTYFNDMVRTMDTDSVRVLRIALLRMNQDRPEETLVLEVIDGLLALREIVVSFWIP